MTETGDNLDDAKRRKKAYFNAWHRGTREMDLLIGGFAERHLDGLSPAQFERFEALLELPDTDLYAWITGRETPPPEVDSDVLRRLCRHRVDPVRD
jgi:antitoxin CptB